jgi:hypothetical protein
VAHGIGDSGLVVGSYSDTSSKTRGFVLDRGSYTPVDYPGAIFTSLMGVNVSGMAAGYFLDTNFNENAFTVDPRGNLQPLAISGAAGSAALAINNRGVVTGYYHTAGEQPVGFILDGDDLTTIDLSSQLPASFDRNGFTFHLTPDSQFTQILGINNRGEVIARLQAQYEGSPTGSGGGGDGSGGGHGGGPGDGHGPPPPPPGPTVFSNYSRDFLGSPSSVK